jgi:hypothetical protein
MGPVERNSVVENESIEQHCESCAFVLIASRDAEITIYPFNKRSNDPHSQSLLGGRIK